VVADHPRSNVPARTEFQRSPRRSRRDSKLHLSARIG
jgi:hypothetical protein